MASTQIEFKEIALEPIRFNVDARLSNTALGLYARDAAQLRMEQDRILDAMVYRLATDVLAEKLVHKHIDKSHVFEHKVRYPLTWWQHFKQDVLDKHRLTRWIVNRWPVRYETKYKREVARFSANFEQFALFPAADILTPPGVHKHIIVPYERITTVE